MDNRNNGHEEMWGNLGQIWEPTAVRSSAGHGYTYVAGDTRIPLAKSELQEEMNASHLL